MADGWGRWTPPLGAGGAGGGGAAFAQGLLGAQPEDGGIGIFGGGSAGGLAGNPPGPPQRQRAPPGMGAAAAAAPPPQPPPPLGPADAASNPLQPLAQALNALGGDGPLAAAPSLWGAPSAGGNVWGTGPGPGAGFASFSVAPSVPSAHSGGRPHPGSDAGIAASAGHSLAPPPGLEPPMGAHTDRGARAHGTRLSASHKGFAAVPSESLASLQIFDYSVPSPSISPAPGPAPSIATGARASAGTRQADMTTVTGGLKSLEDDIEDLRTKLVSRQRKLRSQEEALLGPTTGPEDAGVDVDAELARLYGKYRSPNESSGNLDVDALLDRVRNRPPLAQIMMGAGSASHAAAQPAGPEGARGPPGSAQRGATGFAPRAPTYSGTSSEIFLPAARREEIVASLRTVTGSQAVQRELDRLANPNGRDHEFDTLMHRALEVFVSAQGQLGRLLMHRTANYAVSKLFEVLDARDRLQFLQEIKSRLCRIAQHPQGTFALQKIISALHDPEHLQIVQEGLRFEVRNLALDRNATFTLQKLFSSPLRGELRRLSLSLLMLHTDPRDDALDALVTHISPDDVAYIHQASLNKHGAMLLTAFIRNCPDDCFALLVNIMKPNIVDAACDQYGNYVVQKALERACTSELHGATALLIADSLCFPDETLERVASDSYGVKVLLSALSQSVTMRDKISDRIFPEHTAATAAAVVTGAALPAPAKLALTLMLSPEASTLLKRAIRLQQDADLRAQCARSLWDLLPACKPLTSASEYERWVHFLERS